MPIIGYCLTYLCYFFRLIQSLQNFSAAVAIINNNDTIRNNFALQVHEVDLETVVLPQVFVANIGDIDQLQVANSSITEDDFPTFGSMSDIEPQVKWTNLELLWLVRRYLVIQR